MDTREVLRRLKASKEIYVMMSGCSRMPFVQCDPDTFDDEIMLFFEEEDAKICAKELKDKGNPVYLVKVENRQFLLFYNSLYYIGVDCMLVKGKDVQDVPVKLQELIVRPAEDQRPAGQPGIENSAFHLTALYFVQILRSKEREERADELKELNEELTAHFQKGNYILPVGEKKEIPLLKQKNGKVFQPLFTDFLEFEKFNKEKRFRAIIVEAGKLPDLMAREAEGVAVNPLGMNLILNVTKKISE